MALGSRGVAVRAELQSLATRSRHRLVVERLSRPAGRRWRAAPWVVAVAAVAAWFAIPEGLPESESQVWWQAEISADLGDAAPPLHDAPGWVVEKGVGAIVLVDANGDKRLDVLRVPSPSGISTSSSDGLRTADIADGAITFTYLSMPSIRWTSSGDGTQRTAAQLSEHVGTAGAPLEGLLSGGPHPSDTPRGPSFARGLALAGVVVLVRGAIFASATVVLDAEAASRARHQRTRSLRPPPS